jgi:hypothetical protein
LEGGHFLMSAFAQMSALLPKANIRQREQNVR